MTSLLVLFFVTLVIAILSGLLFLIHKVPLRYAKYHLMIFSVPTFIALIGMIFIRENIEIGPWHLDVLSWLLAFFILMIGLIIQRFSLRYLYGDAHYRKYFTLFTIMTTFASVAWLSDDLRIMTGLWGITLLCLTLLIKLNKQWKVTKEASKITGILFLVSWLSLLCAILFVNYLSGEWTISTIFTVENLEAFNSWQGIIVQLLLILSVIIPAAQWPFHRWLIESVAAPTPVSAIMHAGIVNVGGVILTRFSPIFINEWTLSILLIIASISVLIGSGISLVHVDYKRQLVGSTMGQMGFMLIQCALGAYSAAIIHLILHGLFKATLFLRSGSAVRHFEVPTRMNESISYIWVLVGRFLAIFIGITFWFITPYSSYQFISALILAWSLSVSWTQLVAFGEGKLGRIIGLIALISIGVVYFAIHNFFHHWLQQFEFQLAEPPLFVVIVMIAMLVLGSLMSMWIGRNKSSRIFLKTYLWLVHLGEAKYHSVESHPRYLKDHFVKGGYKHG